MSIAFVKAAKEIAQQNYSTDVFNLYIKVMADYSLAIAQNVGANLVVVMTASFLHKLADGVTGTFRSNRLIPVLRDIGFDESKINAINICIDNLIPENRALRKTKEELVVADAYILAYWRDFRHQKPIPHFEYAESQKLLQKIDLH